MEAVLFDFDFTLADSSAGAVECVNHALRGLRLSPADPERIRATIGLSLASGFELLSGLTEPRLVAEYSRLFIERADRVMAELTEVYDFVPGVLEELRELGFRLAIVSTKFRRRIEVILRRAGLAQAFEVIVGGEDAPRHKPDPQGLLLAVERLSLGDSGRVYVGDHPVDALAAAAAAIPFLATLTGTSGAEAFRDLGVAAVIPDLRELPEALASGAVSR